ncbi:small ribosomal subunit Rsm22 family protein [Flexivirga oryzae]|uniref:Ribosomal protein RSM22 (Predicted rRNA methylase) n=1 Tax=Flexivirga oryzae TaxID=1794944 RepID=A0A839NCN3_9MICO|nr:small ribosomal subunit Rsm22 family protein [Flexivirga oryzae]MBB2894063.1 ribosomal protein RSM22 (predicted rRNA methylase) [Flexivirga oryzae]
MPAADPQRPVELRLRDALDAAAVGVPRGALSGSVERLIERYRAGGAAAAPILTSPTDVLAYAAYRMPATLAACRSMLRHGAFRLPPIESVVDLGGGTGAAAWAALSEWPEARVTVLDQVGDALALGRKLLAGEAADVEFASWRVGAAVPAADLVTVSYVLSELTPDAQRSLVAAAAGAARRAVAIVEPGTPTGYRRILAARTALLDAGWRIVAPCPHQHPCPLREPDWCHFSARVERSSLHRQLKGGDLGHEDEKFSYVVAVPGDSVDGAVADGGGAEARILRHPVKRKGLVELQLCRPDGSAGRQVVTKRQGASYKQARDVRWGDAWRL